MATTYSFSQFEQFASCPQKYKFQYVEKLDLSGAPSADIMLGQIVHHVLRQFHSLVIDGIAISQEQLLKWYAEEWDDPELRDSLIVTNESKSVDDYIAVGRRMLEQFYATRYPYTDRTVLVTERRISFALPGTQLQFVAQIDLLSRTANGYEITDFKTGSSLPQGVRSDTFLLQMGLYQLAVESQFPDFRPIELVQHWMKFDERLTLRLDDELHAELIERLRLRAVEIWHAKRLDQFPTREGAHCSWCAYQSVCPAKRMRLALAEESGAAGVEIPTAERLAELANRYAALKENAKIEAVRIEELRVEMIEAAKSLNVSKVPTDQGGSIKLNWGRSEKFVNKTADSDKHAELAFLARSLGLDDCFEPNLLILYKEYYRKDKLSAEQKMQLEQYLMVQEDARVVYSPPRKKGKIEFDDSAEE